MQRTMSRTGLGLALAGLLIGLASAASAQDTDQQTTRTRPRIVIHPRNGQLSPNARRYCRSWLVQEYRVSGPVIVPRMQCWWQ